jgi:oxygen-independent coproporphyrinogen-3 oxidase
MSYGTNGSSHSNGTNGTDGGAGAARVPSKQPNQLLELKRGGFIASYPPFESLTAGGANDLWDKPPFGLYVHLPYCRKRCTFCFYKVYTNRNAKPMDRYLEAVSNEIDLYAARPEFRGRQVQTVYFGGGTPTLLSEDELRELVGRLRRNFDIAPGAEFTCESEPGTLTAEKVATLRELGVTRLSMGVQTMDDELLRRNGRSHSSEGVYRAVGWARQNNFPVINLDLMSGVIDETPDSWDRSLQAFIDLEIEHISIYRMEVYKNTLLYAAGYTGAGVGGIPTDAEELALWFQAVDKLETAGYSQVNGHAFIRRPEHDHSHRIDTWGNGGEVLGTGVGSYSYLNDCVFQNTSDWGTYVGKAMHGQSVVSRGARLNSRQKMAREVILGLKLLRVDRPAFTARHGFDIVELWRPQVEALERDGLLDVTGASIEITRRGRPYVDLISSVFCLPEHAANRFQRFATEDELNKATLIDLGTSHSLSDAIAVRPVASDLALV